MTTTNQTHERILSVADEMFATRGYKSVRLRDIATALEMKHTALYYYAQNKEALYMQVMERNFSRHQQQMEAQIAGAGEDIRAQMQAVAVWLMSQPPLNIGRMMQSDFAELSAENARKLTVLLFDALRIPLERAIEQAQQDGIIALDNPGIGAISFISLIETLNAIHGTLTHEERLPVIENIIDMLLKGWLSRE
ncbi:MAG: TetR/AcrR family transcriptional regulator [Aggregatilineales bacterium]